MLDERAADPRTPGTATKQTVPTVPPADKAADAVDVTALLERGRTLATPVLKAAVDRLASPMDTVAAYHFGWIDAQGNPADGDGGKAVRPALAVLSGAGRRCRPRGGRARRGSGRARAQLLPAPRRPDGRRRTAPPPRHRLEGARPRPGIRRRRPVRAGQRDPPRTRHRRGRPRHPPADQRHPRPHRRPGRGHLLRAPRPRQRRGVPGDGGQQDGRPARLRLLHRRGPRRRGRPHRGHAGEVRLPPRPGLPGRRRPPGASGRPAGATASRPGAICANARSPCRSWRPSPRRPASERLGELLAEDAKASDFENFSEEEFAARAALIEEAGGREWTAQEARRQHTIAIEALHAVEMPDQVRAQLAGARRLRRRNRKR